MSLKKLLSQNLYKEKRKMTYIQEVYKRRIQAEIDSYNDLDDKANKDKSEA